MRKIKSEIFYHCDVVRDYAERVLLDASGALDNIYDNVGNAIDDSLKK